MASAWGVNCRPPGSRLSPISNSSDSSLAVAASRWWTSTTRSDRRSASSKTSISRLPRGLIRSLAMASSAHKARTRSLPAAGLAILFSASRQKASIALASAFLGRPGEGLLGE